MTILNRLSLLKRFTIFGMVTLLVIVLLAGLLMGQVWQQRLAARQALAGTPPATVLLDVLVQMQRHRLLSSRQLGNDQAAPAQRRLVQAATDAGLKSLAQSVAGLSADAALIEGLAKLSQGFAILAQEVEQQRLSPRESFDRHVALIRLLDDLMARTLTVSGLVLESDPANHFLILAGFHEGKTVLEQLTQLSDLGTAVLANKGATSLDLNLIASIRAKLEEHDRSFAQTLMLAQDYGGRALPDELSLALKQTAEEIRAVIEMTDLTFLGMSPDWDVPSERYGARLLQAVQAQQRLTQSITGTVVGRLQERSDGLTLFMVSVFVGAIAILVLCGVAFGVSIRSLIRPLEESMLHARRLAEGDLSHSFSSREQHEVGRMLAALETARVNLNVLLAEVRDASSMVSAASQEMRNGNLDLSQRTERTAQQLQSTVQFTRKLQDDVQMTAMASREASELSIRAAEVARSGGSAMSEVMQTMASIRQSSARIGDIIGVIDGIAFQTNILALNAAVEAARAGEQGRGFAVVAGEVRVLAQRSADAAKEIRSLIQDSGRDVARGAELVETTGTTSNDIVAQVERMRTIVERITEATQRQSKDIRDLAAAVGELDEMTQQNAAMVEESSAVTHGMADQASRLQELVDRFRLDTDSPSRGLPGLEAPAAPNGVLTLTR